MKTIKFFLCAGIFAAFMLTSSFFNECFAGNISMYKKYKDWTSFLLDTGNGNKTPRMCTSNIRLEIMFCLDYHGDSYVPLLIITKDKQHRSDPDTKNYKITVQARVDKKQIFYSNGTIDDANGTRFIYLGNAFGSRFIGEAIDGDYFRIKLIIDSDEIPVIKFSLAGFTFAYDRVMDVLMKHSRDDEKYFSSPKKSSDEDYFL